MKLRIAAFAAAALLSLNASAVPITGSLGFVGQPLIFTSHDGLGNPTDETGDGRLMCANGDDLFTNSSCTGTAFETGPATGIDLDGNPTDFSGSNGFSYVTSGATGSLASDYGIGFFSHSVTLNEFDLNTVSPLTPVLEWVIDINNSPLFGTLEFFIETGAETDISAPGNWDIGGTGYFVFTCDANADNCEDETTNGTWSISNSEDFAISITAGNAVPAPSALLMLGLGLLGLGAYRQRRSMS